MQFLINHHLCHNVLVSQPWPCEAAQSCPTLRDSMDCNLPGSSVHGILQARVLEWVAISFPRRSSQPRDGTPVSCTAGRRFTVWAIWYHRLSENGINGLSKITFINSLKLLLTSQVFNTGFPGGSAVKNPPANAGDAGLIPGWGRSPGGVNGYPLLESHGQRNLVGYSPWSCETVRHDLVINNNNNKFFDTLKYLLEGFVFCFFFFLTEMETSQLFLKQSKLTFLKLLTHYNLPEKPGSWLGDIGT